MTRDAEWKGRPWRKYLEPYSVAVKTLLLRHLLNPTHTRRHLSPAKYPIGTYTVLGVTLYSFDDLSAKYVRMLKNPGEFPAEDVKGLRNARRLRAKQLRLDVLIGRHPDIGRLPVIAGHSEKQPLPEDKTLNDLLLQSRTLSLTYPVKYISLWSHWSMVISLWSHWSMVIGVRNGNQAD